MFFINSSNGAKLNKLTGKISSSEISSALKKAMDDISAGSSAMSRRVDEAQKAIKESAATPTNKGEASSSSSLEDRVLKAKRLLAERQAQSVREEENNEKMREQERRHLGQQMSELKRRQEDDAIRAAAEERRKDKEEQKLAKDKIRKQIEQDRLERAEKFSAEKDAAKNVREEKERAALAAAAKKAEQEIAARSSKSRIQFRLPDGRSQTKQFEPDSPLSVIYDFVSNGEEIQIPFANFSLSTTFPSRKLDNEDPKMSLRKLGLVPSGTVLILPKKASAGAGVLNGAGGIFDLFWLILTPFTTLWAFISGFLFGSANQQPQAPRAAGRASVPRRGGNMARLQDYTDDDDEQNTYNGNSTQQM